MGGEMSEDEKTLKELRQITKDKECWKSHIDDVAAILKEDNSIALNAKALWLLGEMGLKHPLQIKPYIGNIAVYLKDDNSKLRERSANAIGRIGRADKDLIIPYMDRLMNLKDDETANVRHAFIWACENIAVNTPELFCDKLEIYYRMIFDSSQKVRIEAPEMFRVVGKRNPECVKPYLEKLERNALNDEHPVVRIHCAGAVRITKNAL